MDIPELVKELVDGIRQYSLSQNKLWQRVPLLALEADGRTGFSDQHARAYENGYWALESSAKEGRYQIFVDLADGRLVNPEYISPNGSKWKELAQDKIVIQLGFHLHELDASAITCGLELDAQKPYPRYYHGKEYDLWRERKRRELRLEELFTRR
jgi:hypothetical protein